MRSFRPSLLATARHGATRSQMPLCQEPVGFGLFATDLREKVFTDFKAH